MDSDKPVLKIRFTDYGPGMRLEDRLVYKLVARHFQIDSASEPDFVICGEPRLEHFQYHDAVKIFFNGENLVPDFNLFDYAIGFDHMEFGDRYLRVPLYVTYEKDMSALAQRTVTPDPSLARRDFCSFVVSSSSGDPMRKKFFDALSKYKKVDSGGRWMNNVGGPVADKAAFLRAHKFNIAFENSSSSGYVTEKLMQALAAQTVPIYFGAPDVEKDFLPDSFIRVKDESDIPRAVEEVIRLDQDDRAYLEKLSAPCVAGAGGGYVRQLEAFLVSILSRPPASAKRRNAYGVQGFLYGRIAKYACLLRRILVFKSRMRRLFFR